MLFPETIELIKSQLNVEPKLAIKTIEKLSYSHIAAAMVKDHTDLPSLRAYQDMAISEYHRLKTNKDESITSSV